MREHALDGLPQPGGWHVAVCGCGWEGPPCPDTVTAANFWGQHLLEEADDA